ncbi:hypothetical protein [Microcoleus sp. B3-D7]
MLLVSYLRELTAIVSERDRHGRATKSRSIKPDLIQATSPGFPQGNSQ